MNLIKNLKNYYNSTDTTKKSKGEALLLKDSRTATAWHGVCNLMPRGVCNGVNLGGAEYLN